MGRCWDKSTFGSVLCFGIVVLISACSQGGFKSSKSGGVIRFGEMGPRVWAGQDRIAGVNEAVNLSADQSNDPKKTFTRFSWNLGDGSTLEGLTIQHAYTQVGTYQATLTATTVDGDTQIDNVQIQVLNKARPAVLETAPTKPFFRPGETAAFDIQIRNVSSIPPEIVDGKTLRGVAITNEWGFPNQLLASGTKPQCGALTSSVQAMAEAYFAGKDYDDLVQRFRKQGRTDLPLFPAPIFRQAWISIDENFPNSESVIRCSMTISSAAVAALYSIPCQLVGKEDYYFPDACQGFRIQVVR